MATAQHWRLVEPNLATEGNSARRFASTRWSVVLAATADSEETARIALAELCQLYWRPIFAFICCRGYSVVNAQDLTQDFFITVLEGNLLKHADPERGRFRSLLLKSVQNFLHKTHEKRTAKRRGGHFEFVSWDEWKADAPSHLNLSKRALDSSTPERLYDIRWAATVVEQALARLREECEAGGRRRVFEALNNSLAADRTDISYLDLAASLGAPETAVKRFLFQLRVRYRALLREEIARTVETDADLEDEIRYLCAVLAGSK